MPEVANPILFADVKSVLDKIIKDWEKGNGSPAKLILRHGATFGWSDRNALLSAQAKGKPLIQPEVIGRAGIGATANIVVDLTTGLGAFPAMPLGGTDSLNNTYFSLQSAEIATIVQWIEQGCN